MMKAIVIILTGICLYGGNLNNVWANASAASTATVKNTAKPVAKTNQYAVNGISVSETAETATKAREKAVLNAQRQALRIFLKRIGADQRFERDIRSQDLDSMVNTMNIFNEKISNDYYSATFNIIFDPNFVRYTLNRLGIKKGTMRSNNILVVPVYIYNGQRRVLNDAAFIAGVWNSVAQRNNVRSYIKLPYNDDTEKIIFSNENLIQALQSNKETLLNKYGADQIIVSEATYNSREDVKTLRIRIIVPDSSTVRNLTVTPEEGQNINYKDFFADAVAKIMDELKIGIMQQASLDENNSDNHAAIVSLKVRSAKDWAALKAKLMESSIITSFEILTIESDKMSIRLLLDPNATQEDINNEISNFNRYL